jgi:hypothetical protein
VLRFSVTCSFHLGLFLVLDNVKQRMMCYSSQSRCFLSSFREVRMSPRQTCFLRHWHFACIQQVWEAWQLRKVPSSRVAMFDTPAGFTHARMEGAFSGGTVK